MWKNTGAAYARSGNVLQGRPAMDFAQVLEIAVALSDSILTEYLPDKMRWHYEDGVFLMALLQLAEVARRDDYRLRVKASYDTLIDSDGTISSYDKEEYNLDRINAGKALFDLYKLYGQAKYRKAIEALMDQLRSHMRTRSGGFWHKKIYPWQIWLDGLYMAGPFYARYIAEFEDKKDFSDIISQFVHAEEKTRDVHTGLLYHAWDESRQQLWADPVSGCSPHFWGRAMGWYCMASVDVIELLPSDYDQIDVLESIVKRLVKTVVAYQDENSGLWYQVLDQGGRQDNYLESSASAMFVYFLLKANRLGIIDESASLKAARMGYDGLVKNRIRKDEHGLYHLDGICSVAGLGGNPYRNGSYAYYVKEPVVMDDFKGVGPFILASIELAKSLS